MDVLIVVGALFAGVGALLFAVGAFFLRAGRRFDRGAVRAPGQVVDVRWQTLGTAGGGPASTTSATPCCASRSPTGVRVETVARTTTSADALQQGRAVTVLYDPADPQQARIASSAGPALLTGVFMVIGGVFFLLGLALVAGGIALRDALPEQ